MGKQVSFAVHLPCKLLSALGVAPSCIHAEQCLNCGISTAALTCSHNCSWLHRQQDLQQDPKPVKQYLRICHSKIWDGYGRLVLSPCSGVWLGGRVGGGGKSVALLTISITHFHSPAFDLLPFLCLPLSFALSVSQCPQKERCLPCGSSHITKPPFNSHPEPQYGSPILCCHIIHRGQPTFHPTLLANASPQPRHSDP